MDLKTYSTQNNSINLLHIESRPNKSEKGKYEFFVTCSGDKPDVMRLAIEQLSSLTDYMHVLTSDGTEKTGKKALKKVILLQLIFMNLSSLVSSQNKGARSIRK